MALTKNLKIWMGIADYKVAGAARRTVFVVVSREPAKYPVSARAYASASRLLYERDRAGGAIEIDVQCIRR
jgi:hypothetical protein